MKVLILGAGNLLLSDEGFGVHAIRFLERSYDLPACVELYDAGTLGIMVTHRVEESDLVYILDAVAAEGEPGVLLRFDKADFMLDRVPVKLSPHQAGVQEMLLVSELRGRCPQEVVLLGVIPASLAPGCALSPRLQARLPEIAESLVQELRARTGLAIPARPEAAPL